MNKYYKKFHSFTLAAPNNKIDIYPFFWADRIMSPPHNMMYQYQPIRNWYEQRDNIINNKKETNFAVSLKNKTVKELKDFCRLNKIKGFSNKKKNELITHILKNY